MTRQGRLREKISGAPIDETFTGMGVRLRTTPYKHSVDYEVFVDGVSVWKRTVLFDKRYDNMCRRFEAARAQEAEAGRLLDLEADKLWRKQLNLEQEASCRTTGSTSAIPTPVPSASSQA